MGCERKVEYTSEVEFDIEVDVKCEVKTATSEPQVFWLNAERATEAKSVNYFVSGNEQRSFRGVEVVEATSVVKAASAMQEALVEVTTVMHEYDLPEEVIETVLNALELAKATNVLKYRPRTAK